MTGVQTCALPICFPVTISVVLISVVVVLNPPIKPADAVIVPFALALKLDADIKNPLPVAEPLRKKPLPVIAS